MGSIARQASRALRKVASIVSNLLPSPPSDEAPPPDVDGRRPMDADLTRVKFDIERKDGKGGYR